MSLTIGTQTKKSTEQTPHRTSRLPTRALNTNKSTHHQITDGGSSQTLSPPYTDRTNAHVTTQSSVYISPKCNIYSTLSWAEGYSDAWFVRFPTFALMDHNNRRRHFHCQRNMTRLSRSTLIVPSQLTEMYHHHSRWFVADHATISLQPLGTCRLQSRAYTHTREHLETET